MKKASIILTTFSFVCVLLPNNSFASKVKIINNTNDNIQVFFRGKGSPKHATEVLTANTIASYNITPEYLDNKPVFEAIASTGSDGSPDWKLLGGLCTNLEADKNYTLLIEKTLQGLKTSCTTLVE